MSEPGQGAGNRRTPGTMSLREALRRLRRAYAVAEEGSLQAAYDDVRCKTRLGRPLLALADSLYPIGAAVRLAGEVDRGIRHDGLADGCAAAAERLGLACDFEIPEATRDVLASAPAVVYGNHPTLLTPFLVGAAIRRPDVRLLMLSYVGRLIPSLRSYMLPLEIPSRGSWLEWRRGGGKRLIALWLMRFLEAGGEEVDAKLANREALRQGVSHVAAGGCVILFPSGGGRRESAWYPGIGHLVSELARDARAASVFLVPMREEESPKGHVYGGLRGIDCPARGGTRPQVRVRFAEPCRLTDLVNPSDSGPGVAVRLERHYESVFHISKSHGLERLFLPRRLRTGRHRTSPGPRS